MLNQGTVESLETGASDDGFVSGSWTRRIARVFQGMFKRRKDANVANDDAEILIEDTVYGITVKFTGKD